MTVSYEEASLTIEQRDTLLATLKKDGFCCLPMMLPTDLHEAVSTAIDRIADERRAADPSINGVKVQNCVDEDQTFRDLMCFKPALQLAYDTLGPMFHLNQSNMMSRPKAKEGDNLKDSANAIDWHADGPRPNMFPRVGPDRAMGLHYLKFGYFLNDVPTDGSPLQVVRGSHLKDERDGMSVKEFAIDEYKDDLVTFDVPAGTIVAFHQALWHAAGPNRSAATRKNVYISYCPTWMRPVDREFPTEEQLEGANPVERWLLGEPRPPLQWWLPSAEDYERLKAYSRGDEVGAASPY